MATHELCTPYTHTLYVRSYVHESLITHWELLTAMLVRFLIESMMRLTRGFKIHHSEGREIMLLRRQQRLYTRGVRQARGRGSGDASRGGSPPLRSLLGGRDAWMAGRVGRESRTWRWLRASGSARAGRPRSMLTSARGLQCRLTAASVRRQARVVLGRTLFGRTVHLSYAHVSRISRAREHPGTAW